MSRSIFLPAEEAIAEKRRFNRVHVHCCGVCFPEAEREDAVELHRLRWPDRDAEAR